MAGAQVHRGLGVAAEDVGGAIEDFGQDQADVSPQAIATMTVPSRVPVGGQQVRVLPGDSELFSPCTHRGSPRATWACVTGQVPIAGLEKDSGWGGPITTGRMAGSGGLAGVGAAAAACRRLNSAKSSVSPGWACWAWAIMPATPVTG